ncbi:MAG: head-tail connector protein, partial [Phycisphaerales bacterium]
MDYQITTAPAHEPVSLEQAKRHLRVDDGDSDTLIRSYLQSARSWCEEYAGRAFLWQTFTGRLDVFPVLMQMPRPPLLSISSITYVDT